VPDKGESEFGLQDDYCHADDVKIMRRAKTDLTELNMGPPRSRLPIFVSNHNARMWLDMNKSNSLDAGRWRQQLHHPYVNVAPPPPDPPPPRPPKTTQDDIRIDKVLRRRSNPVYENVYTLGRRQAGDFVKQGRYVVIQSV
jgi:hypothetical protein